MTALTAARDTRQLGDKSIVDYVAVPQKGSTVLYPGAMVALQGGYAVPASASSALKVIGKYEPNPNNGTYGASDTTGLADGAVTVLVRRGTFKWNNSASTDLIAQANAGADCYAVDDNTVALTDGGSGARPRAGKILQVDSDGVWVEMLGSRDEAMRILTLPIDLASIGAGQVVAAMVLPFGGKLVKTQFLTNKPATTAAKAATLQPRLTPAGGAAANVTGGALALTSANQTPQGNLVAGSAITAANSFNAGDSIDVQASGLTAFVEGSGTLVLTFGP